MIYTITYPVNLLNFPTHFATNKKKLLLMNLTTTVSSFFSPAPKKTPRHANVWGIKHLPDIPPPSRKISRVPAERQYPWAAVGLVT